jgi:putative ABC transport system permease protein
VLSLTVIGSNLARDAQFSFVSPATFDKLVAAGFTAQPSVMLFGVSDTATAMRSVSDIVGAGSTIQIGGSATMRDVIEQVLSIMVDVLTALLAVAVVIALVGVSNTLSLSVIERTRESALLRALGLQRGQLRLMLLYEALLLTLVSAVVGVIFGAFFGYAGAHAVIGQVVAESDTTMPLRFAIDWPGTLGLLGILVVAAGLASVLPGRRAASATPVEALAEV